MLLLSVSHGPCQVGKVGWTALNRTQNYSFARAPDTVCYLGTGRVLKNPRVLAGTCFKPLPCLPTGRRRVQRGEPEAFAFPRKPNMFIRNYYWGREGLVPATMSKIASVFLVIFWPMIPPETLLLCTAMFLHFQ